jgi:cytochrome b involved in lipid metabolism
LLHPKHNTEEDCWIIIGNEKNGGPKVYDVTKYLDDHPGGAEVMMEFAGETTSPSLLPFTSDPILRQRC